MSKIPIQLSTLIALILLSCSQCVVVQKCPDKESFLTSFDKLIEEINRNEESLTESEWKSKDMEVKQLLDICYTKYEEELSLRDKISIMKNTVLYGAYRELEDLKLESYDLKSEIENIGSEGKREIERFIKDELGANLESAIDDVLEGINELGEELKSWLKE